MKRKYDLAKMRREIAEDEATLEPDKQASVSQDDIQKMVAKKRKRVKKGGDRPA